MDSVTTKYVIVLAMRFVCVLHDNVFGEMCFDLFLNLHIVRVVTGGTFLVPHDSLKNLTP